jgi:hypothetical protein
MKSSVKLFANRTYILIVCSVVIIPNLFVVAFGIENFPFTSAPMFGHYVGPETELYVFKFEGVKDEKRTLILPEENGRPEPVFMRQFFSQVYGSSDSLSPFSAWLDDSPEKFKRRMEDFFMRYTDFLVVKRNKKFDRIDLILERVDHTGKPLHAFRLGYFDTNSNQYNIVANSEN